MMPPPKTSMRWLSTLPLPKKVKMEKIQVYARANNLFSLDHVKYMNCEDLKINYPDMTSVYFGLNINF